MSLGDGTKKKSTGTHLCRMAKIEAEWEAFGLDAAGRVWWEDIILRCLWRRTRWIRRIRPKSVRGRWATSTKTLPHTSQVKVAFVPSNHGEFRIAKGSVVTDRARDNADLVIADSVTKIMQANPDRYGHVTVWAPPLEGADPFVLTLDLGGVLVGFTHGHQVGAGKNRMGQLEQWWKNHQWSDARRPDHETLPTAADCDIMVAAHGHTFMLSEQTGKLMVQCPAAESGGRDW